MRRIVVLAVVAGCHRAESTVRPDPTAPVSAKPPIVDESKKLPPPVHEVSGPIKGGFEVRAQRATVGAPIVATLAVEPTGKLGVYIGGDQRNAANFPTRVAVLVKDEKGAVVCDSVTKPALPNFGGLGSEQTFLPGTPMREPLVLNPMCPALNTPGRYRVTLHRRLAPSGMTTPGHTPGVPMSCDIYPVHPGPLPSVGYPSACYPMMAALPGVTSTFELEVLPFDAAALARAVELRLQEAAEEPDGMARHRIRAWLCGWVACACSKIGGPEFEPGMLPKTSPSTLDAGCPR